MSFFPPAVRNRLLVLLIAAVTDLVVGDPQGLWHPVQGIGALISLSEKMLRALFRVPAGKASFEKVSPEEGSSGKVSFEKASPEEGSSGKVSFEKAHPEERSSGKTSFEKAVPGRSERVRSRTAGILMVLIVLFVCTGLTAAGLRLCTVLHPVLGVLAEGILCGRLLALRSLGEAGFSVRDPLLRGDIEGARRAVSMIVGRDTDRLDAEGITKAAIETVAENTSDGVTAPLFFIFLLGGPGCVFYKAVNTMDSMTGYRNERYRYFGTAAARLDDVLNFIPSRLTALLMILACFLSVKTTVPCTALPCGRGGTTGERGPGDREDGAEETRPKEHEPKDRDPKGQPPKTVRIPDGVSAFRIWKRDRGKSPSPNSAQTESVCAGALHLRLLGDAWYFGELHRKEEIGDGGRYAEPGDIARAVHLLYGTAILMFAAETALLILLCLRL